VAPDIRFAVYRGADAENPDIPGTKMCRNRDDRRAAEVRGLDAAKVVCPACPSRDGCALLAQAARRADIWFVPHNLIFLQKPRALGDLAWLIVDENPIGAALIGWTSVWQALQKFYVPRIEQGDVNAKRP